MFFIPPFRFQRWLWRLFVTVAVGGTAWWGWQNDLLQPSDSAWETIRLQGVIRFAVVPEFYPFSFRTDQGVLDGFDVAVARRVAEDMGYTARFESAYSEEIATLVLRGKADLGVVGWVPQEEEPDLFAPLPSYWNEGIYLLLPARASNPTSLAAAKEWCSEHRIAVVWGDDGDVLGRVWQRAMPHLDIAPYTSLETIRQALRSGEVDGAFLRADQVWAFQQRSSNPALWDALPIQDRPHHLVVLQSSPRLAQQVRDSLSHLEEDGILGDLRANWFGANARSLRWAGE